MDVPSISPTVTLEYSTPLKRVTVFFSAWYQTQDFVYVGKQWVPCHI
jgi:hypothetical protein